MIRNFKDYIVNEDNMNKEKYRDLKNIHYEIKDEFRKLDKVRSEEYQLRKELEDYANKLEDRFFKKNEIKFNDILVIKNELKDKFYRNFEKINSKIYQNLETIKDLENNLIDLL